jgi:hypothetical protein
MPDASRAWIFNNFIMRNNYLLQICLALLIGFCAITGNAQSTTALVGEVRNGKATVSNLSEATRVLKGGLSASAVIANITIEYSEGEKSFFLVGSVANDPVTGKAVQLSQNGGVLYASAGPGIEITCHGTNCPSCLPDVKKWKPRCVCHETIPGKEAQCDMQSKVVIGF